MFDYTFLVPVTKILLMQSFRLSEFSWNSVLLLYSKLLHGLHVMKMRWYMSVSDVDTVINTESEDDFAYKIVPFTLNHIPITLIWGKRHAQRNFFQIVEACDHERLWSKRFRTRSAADFSAAGVRCGSATCRKTEKCVNWKLNQTLTFFKNVIYIFWNLVAFDKKTYRRVQAVRMLQFAYLQKWICSYSYEVSATKLKNCHT